MTEKHANPEDFDLYALGALDGEEKQRFESHLRACPACRQELAAAREGALLLGLSAPPLAPRPEVKAALMERVREERVAAERVQQMPVRAERRRRVGFGFSFAFGLAAAVLALVAVLLWKEDRQNRQDAQQLQAQLGDAQSLVAKDRARLDAINSVIEAADTIQVTLKQQAHAPEGAAHVLYNARLQTMLYSAKMSPTPQDKSYQLWLVPVSGAPVDAGLITADRQGQVVIVHVPAALAAKAFAVTLEPAGGRPQPTGPFVLVGAVG